MKFGVQISELENLIKHETGPEGIKSWMKPEPVQENLVIYQMTLTIL